MRPRVLWLGFAFMVLAIGSQPVHALLIVDTGQPGTGSPTFIGGSSKLVFAAEFTTSSDYTVTAVHAFMQKIAGETATLLILDDAGDVPGSTVHHSTPFTGHSDSAAWQGASGLSWDLPAGTYWVAFGPSWVQDDFAGELLRGAPSPLDHEAAKNSTMSWWSYDDLDFGVRIEAIPEPSAALLLATGLVGLALHRRHHRR
jgi:hypothetical protein